MIHYTCDRCQRVINDEEELRFEVNIVVEVNMDGQHQDAGDEPREQLDELNELLGTAIDAANEELFQTQRYDMCASCYQEYARNPLGCEPQVQVEFSEN